jgi:hypothetical protein
VPVKSNILARGSQADFRRCFAVGFFAVSLFSGQLTQPSHPCSPDDLRSNPLRMSNMSAISVVSAQS